jgi:hypothetical protein
MSVNNNDNNPQRIQRSPHLVFSPPSQQNEIDPEQAQRVGDIRHRNLGENNSAQPHEAQPLTLGGRISNAFTRFRNFFRRSPPNNVENASQNPGRRLVVSPELAARLRNAQRIPVSQMQSRTRMVVDVNELDNNPRGILIQLDSLVKGDPLPRIKYTDGDNVSEGQDEGGLRKDFIARLMKNLFIESDNDTKPKDNHLQTEKGFPIAFKNESDIVCYNELGNLFAQSLNEKGLIKMGPLFSESFYTILSSRLLQKDKNSDDWFIQSYLDTSLSPSHEDRELILQYLANEEVNLTSTAQQIIQNILLVAAEDIPDEELMTDESRKTVKYAVLELAKDSEKLNAVMMIADQMEAKTEDKQKLIQLAANPKTLQEEIEGTLNSTQIIEKMDWNFTESVSKNNADKVQEYLTDWISNANSEMLLFYMALLLPSEVRLHSISNI